MTWQAAACFLAASMTLMALGAYANYRFIKRIAEREDSQ